MDGVLSFSHDWKPLGSAHISTYIGNIYANWVKEPQPIYREFDGVEVKFLAYVVKITD